MLTNTKFILLKEKITADSWNGHLYKLSDLESLYELPVDSKFLGIAVIADRSKTSFKVKVVTTAELVHKVALLPFNKGFALMPLLHENKFI